MAKQSKDVFSITPISLATEAAVQEAAAAAAAAQSSNSPSPTVPAASPSGQDGGPVAPSPSPTVPGVSSAPKPSRRGATPEPVIKSDAKEQRINRTFTITATNDRRLGMASVHYGVTKSAILEQLFEQFWAAHENEIRN